MHYTTINIQGNLLSEELLQKIENAEAQGQQATDFGFEPGTNLRNVIAEQPGNKQIVAEEMWLWGYEGDVSQKQFLSKETAMHLLMNAKPTQNMEEGEKAYWLNEEMQWMMDEKTFRSYTDPVALERANHLVESHTRFRKLVSGNNYKVVEPVLPMDVLGLYVLLPVT